MTKIRNKFAFPLAIISGILLIFSGSTNSGKLWKTVKDYAEEYAPKDAKTIIGYIFFVLIFFAVLGGISVILGGLLIKGNRTKLGKLLIALGAGMGIIGLLIGFIVATAKGNDDTFFMGLSSITGIGIILSIFARIIAK